MRLCQELDRLDAYDFPLPPERIARYPQSQRDASRLLVVGFDRFDDRRFRDLPALLTPGDLLVLNDSRVIHARVFGRKATGGEVEVLFERLIGEKEALALVRASKSPKPGTTLHLAKAFTVEVVDRHGDLFHVRLLDDGALFDWIERFGQLPIPPYLERQPEETDETRYQTVFARHPGSVAAPTAGLHFTEPLLTQLQNLGVGLAWVTLHVGAGTFQPVRTERVSEHRMHAERFVIPEATVEAITRTKAAGKRVIAVGTTALRTLEGAACHWGTLRAGQGETDLFIRPGFRFQVVDALITNFHLPRSTLIMLVAAFAGYQRTMAAYRHALAGDYRFFSYGDAMFLPQRYETDWAPPDPR
jgi:S-adenosylmethionine:tRNA ribosyltransferase-isomerase